MLDESFRHVYQLHIPMNPPYSSANVKQAGFTDRWAILHHPQPGELH
jgi:hypothetical protein